MEREGWRGRERAEQRDSRLVQHVAVEEETVPGLHLDRHQGAEASHLLDTLGIRAHQVSDSDVVHAPRLMRSRQDLREQKRVTRRTVQANTVCPILAKMGGGIHRDFESGGSGSPSPDKRKRVL